jgi:hypothetical protein
MCRSHNIAAQMKMMLATSIIKFYFLKKKLENEVGLTATECFAIWPRAREVCALLTRGRTHPMIKVVVQVFVKKVVVQVGSSLCKV